MASAYPLPIRNRLIAEYREVVINRWGMTPFAHQREYWAASEGRELIHNQLTSPDDPFGRSVLVPGPDPAKPFEGAHTEVWATIPREAGTARFLSDLGSYKIGKSFGAAAWMTGFAVIPNARVSLVGLEYDICEPEFSYLCDFLLSEKGMGLKYVHLQNDARTGRMYLDLTNGARFEAKSWERKDTLKGKEIDCYCFCEAFMLPGYQCFGDNSQNLRARRGFALFPTTPDRPWIEVLHRMGHGADPEWHCTCSVPATANPFTFDLKAKERDRALMTREKFAIHYEGKIGDYVGRVFDYKRGQAQFTPTSHPELFGGGERAHQASLSPVGVQRSLLTLPDGWEIIGGADTGGYYTALLAAFSPSGDAFVVEEFPNYDYLQSGVIERDEGITIPQWTRRITSRAAELGAKGVSYWADPNSQFKKELFQYGLNLLAAPLPLEARTEIAREYFQHHRVWLAPWLSILPFEIENAAWPEEATAAGKFARVKDRDHTLDCLEHILARRPRGAAPAPPKQYPTAIENILGRPMRRGVEWRNPHAGRY